MDRTLLSIVVLVIFLFGGYFVLFVKRGSAGEEYRLAARELIAQVEGYSGRPDYYDWLVDWAHDEVFNDAFKMESRGRRRVATWVDEDRYLNDLFRVMMQRAKEDNAHGVVTALADLKASVAQEQEPQPRQPPPGVRNRR